MKQLIVRWAFGLLGTVALVAPAMAQEFRVGFVNTDRILRDANASKAAQTRLEQEFSKRDKEINDLQASLKTGSERFERDAPTLSES